MNQVLFFGISTFMVNFRFQYSTNELVAFLLIEKEAGKCDS